MLGFGTVGFIDDYIQGLPLEGRLMFLVDTTAKKQRDRLLHFQIDVVKIYDNHVAGKDVALDRRIEHLSDIVLLTPQLVYNRGDMFVLSPVCEDVVNKLDI